LNDIDQYAQSYSALASSMFTSDAIDSSVKVIDYSIALNPNNAVYHYKRGQFFIASGNNNEAIESLTRAVELNKSYSDAWHLLGLANYNLRKYEIAIKHLRKTTELDYKNFPAQKTLADAWFALKNYNEAAQNYEAALGIGNASKSNVNPTSIVEVYNSLGKSYYALNEKDTRALDAYKTAIKKSPVYAEALFNRGLYYNKTGDVNSAIEDIEKAISISGDNTQWDFELARNYYDKRDFANAARFYNTTVRMDSTLKYPLATYQAGVCNVELKDFNAALKNYNQVQKLKLDTAIALFNYEMGNVYLNLAKTDSASLYFDKAYAKDSSNGNTIYAMAIVQLQRSKPADALLLFDKAFKTGQLDQKQVKNDRLLATIKDDKNFKALVKKYL
jgi:tetratricopeptide (TPR) repeat protein